MSTKLLSPGDTWRGIFDTNGTSGASVADALPSCYLVRNGTLDTAVSVTVAQNTASQLGGTNSNVYGFSLTVPTNYAALDYLGVVAIATVGGATARRSVDAVRLVNPALSGSAAPATEGGLLLAGTSGASQTLSLAQLNVTAGGTANAVNITGGFNGDGVNISSGSGTGRGVFIIGGSSGGRGIDVRGGQGVGTNAQGLYIQGGGTGSASVYTFPTGSAAGFDVSHGGIAGNLLGSVGGTVTLASAQPNWPTLANLANLDLANSMVLSGVEDFFVNGVPCTALSAQAQTDVRTAMTAQGFTVARAAKIDNLDGTISGLSTGQNTIITRIGTPATSVSADIAAVKTDTGSIKPKTDNLPADPASQAGKFNLVDVDGITATRYLKSLVAFLGGRTAFTDNGDGTASLAFKAQDGTTTVLTITFNKTDGHRTAATIA